MHEARAMTTSGALAATRLPVRLRHVLVVSLNREPESRTSG
jgi:hypothetical protein